MPQTLSRTLAIIAAIAATSNPLAAQQPTKLDVPLVSNVGNQIGQISLRGGPGAVVMRIEINAGGLSPGWHGLHFHAVGDCSDKEKFQNSKAHINHGSKPHGLLNPKGTEEGDLPNLWVAADGSAKAEIASQLVTLDSGPHALRDGDGSALIVHANEDDHFSQPIGNSGARIACAQIK